MLTYNKNLDKKIISYEMVEGTSNNFPFKLEKFEQDIRNGNIDARNTKEVERLTLTTSVIDNKLFHSAIYRVTTIIPYVEGTCPKCDQPWDELTDGEKYNGVKHMCRTCRIRYFIDPRCGITLHD